MFMMVDFVREMSEKKSCGYGEYGLFEHLLFLFCKERILFSEALAQTVETNAEQKCRLA